MNIILRFLHLTTSSNPFVNKALLVMIISTNSSVVILRSSDFGFHQIKMIFFIFNLLQESIHQITLFGSVWKNCRGSSTFFLCATLLLDIRRSLVAYDLQLVTFANLLQIYFHPIFDLFNLIFSDRLNNLGRR